MESQSKHVLITGATGGIGSEIAKHLAAENFQLLLTGRNQARLNRLLCDLPGKGHSSLAADLQNEEDIYRLAQTAQMEGVNVLINCLGAGQLSLLEDLQASDVNQILTTNLEAPINVCRSLIPYFKTLPAATIVNVGSILGSIGFAGSTLYSASKFGLRGFTEALRRELADSQVRILYFAPRATNTSLNSDEMNEMNKLLGNKVDSAADVAAVLTQIIIKGGPTSRYLGWPESFFVRVNSLFPRLVDQSVRKQLSVIKRFAKPAVKPNNPMPISKKGDQ
jgi:short-subunit dehydrogenase